MMQRLWRKVVWFGLTPEQCKALRELVSVANSVKEFKAIAPAPVTYFGLPVVSVSDKQLTALLGMLAPAQQKCVQLGIGSWRYKTFLKETC